MSEWVLRAIHVFANFPDDQWVDDEIPDICWYCLDRYIKSEWRLS